jgi:ubiquinone/menaquinone biosynthesis C-methylase UbiE
VNANPQNTVFAGSIPALYEECLGPVIFTPYADDLTRRIRALVPTGRILETACGTGLLTRRLDAALPKEVHITATDLSDGMVAFAKTRLPASPRVDWRTADASALPFDAASFDLVVCEFGMMFLPDKAAGFREAHRVLRPGSTFLFNVWCGLEDNPYGQIAHTTIAKFFASNPPTFYQIPFGFHDQDAISGYLRSTNFVDVTIERVSFDATAPSAAHFARGLVEGTPIANAITEAGLPFDPIREAVTAALVAHGGDGPWRSSMAALVCSGRVA